MVDKNLIKAAEVAAEEAYHWVYESGGTIEDSVNAGADAYERVAGEKMENPIEFFGWDEDSWDEIKDT